MTISTVAVCCDDLSLMADARRLAATAGWDVEVAGTLDAHRWWSVASVVLLDGATAAQLEMQGLPRRSRVALLTRVDDPAVWRLGVLLGADQVVSLPADETALLRGVLAARTPMGAVPVVACVPAAGGAGASTVAAGIALTAARAGAETLLVDTDSAAGGLDVLLGAEHAPGLRWPDVASLDADTPVDVILEGLVRLAPRLRLLSWGRCDADTERPCTDWPLDVSATALELVVLDVPRPTADVHVPSADVVLLVVRAGVRQTVAASSLAKRLRSQGNDVRLVVRAPARGGLRPADVENAVGLPVALALPEDRRLAAATDDGQLARALARLPFDQLVTTLLESRVRAA